MIKQKYLDSFVVVMHEGRQVAARLSDADKEQLEIFKKYFPEMFEKEQPEKKAKPE